VGEDSRHGKQSDGILTVNLTRCVTFAPRRRASGDIFQYMLAETEKKAENAARFDPDVTEVAPVECDQEPAMPSAINTRTATGRFFLTMAGAFAEMERGLIGERTSSALQHKKAGGARLGGMPFGFTA
jgi:hypothetical protein